MSAKQTRYSKETVSKMIESGEISACTVLVPYLTKALCQLTKEEINRIAKLAAFRTFGKYAYTLRSANLGKEPEDYIVVVAGESLDKTFDLVVGVILHEIAHILLKHRITGRVILEDEFAADQFVFDHYPVWKNLVRRNQSGILEEL